MNDVPVSILLPDNVRVSALLGCLGYRIESLSKVFEIRSNDLSESFGITVVLILIAAKEIPYADLAIGVDGGLELRLRLASSLRLLLGYTTLGLTEKTNFNL